MRHQVSRSWVEESRGWEDVFEVWCTPFCQNDVIVCISAVTTTRLGDGCVRCIIKINVDLPKKSMMVAIEMFARVVCVAEFRNGLTQG